MIESERRQDEPCVGRQNAEEEGHNPLFHHRASICASPLLFERNPQPMWVTDVLDGRFLAANQSALDLFGYSAQELLELREDALFANEQGMIAHRGQDGTQRKLLVFSDEIEMCGRPARLHLGNDVTEKHLVQEQLLRAQRMESLGALAGGVAHDLNNLLTPILMGAGVLRRSIKDPGDLETLLLIEDSAIRGGQMVAQLLAFGKGVESKKEEIGLGMVIQEVMKIVSKTFDRRIRIRVDIDRGIPNLRGDFNQLHQMLLNLCINARDAMQEGGTLTVDAGYAEAEVGRFTRLKVTDTGHGIPPENLSKIFDPFFTTKAAGQGTGLGLSTTQTIVKDHGGFIRVNSRPGHGTSVSVYLPIEG